MPGPGVGEEALSGMNTTSVDKTDINTEIRMSDTNAYRVWDQGRKCGRHVGICDKGQYLCVNC